MQRLTRSFAPLLAAALTLLVWTAAGQPPDAPPQDPDQQQDGDFDPEAANRGVARISLMNGDVSVRRGDNGDFVAAVLNAPLVVGDRVLTGPNSRAEIQFDSANLIRISSDSEIRLAELGDRHYQIQLARGVATFRVLRQSEADVEVSTPQASIRPRNQGVYRLLVREDGQSEITVRSGSVEVFTPRGVETLQAGRTMQMRGTAADPEFQVVAAMGEDEWDRWNTSRDATLQRASSPRYVNRDVYGTEDLDAYGRWVPDPAYGNVWAPTVAAGWAPYREGRWVWIDYYGWTWVSYDPWGWAPYHYGRWYMSPTYGWCWYPGGIGFGVRHYWRPALVSFVGFGHGGVGVGFGRVGWIPLAPHERYHPWYGRGYSGGRNVNIVTNVNVYSNYRNARIRNGVTAVDGAGFTHGAAGRAFTGDIRQASVVRGSLPLSPTRESMRLSDRSVHAGTIQRSSDNQRFFSSRQAGQWTARSASQPRISGPGLGPGSAGQGVVRGQDGQHAAQNQGGWRRFGEPTRPGFRASERTTPVPSGNSSGRFGEPNARSSRGEQASRPAQNGSSGSWQRFEGRTPPPDASSGQPVQSPRYSRGSDSPNTNRYTAPPAPDRGGSYRNSGNSYPQPVRISPPMVRERSAAPAPSRSESARPSGGGGPRGGGGGGGSRGGGGGGAVDSSRGGGGGGSHGGRGR